jgi:diguanylate cyclase (GGDEF)-like protein/PAS domain S-box-containing protein
VYIFTPFESAIMVHIAIGESYVNQAEKRLRNLTECFLSFGVDPLDNINKLVSLCGELMDATCALYNRLEEGMLCSWGQWNVPSDHERINNPEGHICYDVITHCSDEVIFIPKLSESRYAGTDPNVKQYALKTYIGKAVTLGNECCGSLCVVYQKDFVPSEDDRKLISGIASAIGVEEKRREVEENLRQSEEKYRSLVESTEDSIYLVDMNCRYLFMNKKHLSRLCLPKGGFLGRMYNEFHSQKETKEFIEKMNMVCKTGESIQYEHRSDRDGRYFLRTVSPVNNSDGITMAVTVVSKDITDRKQMEEKLRDLSFTDELTGLYNRRGFFAFVAQQLKLSDRLKRGVFMLYADMDGLKSINDTLGHLEGDQALIDMANILKATYRDSDIVGRIGGDEFVVIPIGTTGDDIKIITDRFQENLENHNAKRNRGYKLSISIGVSYYDPENPCSIDELLLQADRMMYEQKKLKKKS